MLTALKAFLAAWFHALRAEARELYADAMLVKSGGFTVREAAERSVDRGQLGFQTLIAAFVIVITGMAVILVLDKFDASLGTPSDGNLSQSSDNLLSGFSSMVDIIEPLLLVAIVVVVISLVRRVQ